MINGMILIFEIVNFPLRDRDVPRSPSYGVYISQLILEETMPFVICARVYSNVTDLTTEPS